DPRGECCGDDAADRGAQQADGEHDADGTGSKPPPLEVKADQDRGHAESEGAEQSGGEDECEIAAGRRHRWMTPHPDPPPQGGREIGPDPSPREGREIVTSCADTRCRARRTSAIPAEPFPD